MNQHTPFHTDRLRLLGDGGESLVYELDEHRVLRVLKRGGDQSTSMRRLQELYDAAAPLVPFALPRLLEIGTSDGQTYSIEQRIPGLSMRDVLPPLRGPDRTRLLGNYLSAAQQLKTVTLDDRPYGELLTPEPLTGDTWHGFLTAAIDRVVARHGEALRADTGFDDDGRRRLLAQLAHVPERPPKALVHGDFFPSNVMVSDDLEISGVLDFSPMTVVGDAQVDVAGSLMWLEVVPGYRAADSQALRRLITDRHGREIEPALSFYRVFYSLYFMRARDDDPMLYRWCVRNLRRWRQQS
jgi:putative membrane protein